MEVAVAGAGNLASRINLPGEIVLNADRVAHIVPRAPGIVREVVKTVGDTVRAGEGRRGVTESTHGDLEGAMLRRRPDSRQRQVLAVRPALAASGPNLTLPSHWATISIAAVGFR